MVLLWNEESLECSKTVGLTTKKVICSTYISMSRIVSVSTVLVVFFVEQHDFCSIKVIQFQFTIFGQEELR